jgi:hypothetical protein
MRPKLSTSDASASIVGRIGGLFLDAWFIMLLAPTAVDRHPSYWQSFALLLIARLVLTRTPDYTRWTHKAARG